MRVVHVWHVGVRMTQRLVPVSVAVCTGGHGVVRVRVVPVVVAVRLFMLQRFMRMLVSVGLGQTQHDAGQHQQAAQNHQFAG